MTEETGGRLIDVGNNSKKLEEAFQQMEDELRTQYAASYTPTNAVLDGGFRRLGVECRGDGLKVQVRKGYFAARGNNLGLGIRDLKSLRLNVVLSQVSKASPMATTVVNKGGKSARRGGLAS